MNIISVFIQKGGVGKTTLSFNMAKILAQKGYNVLAIDNDAQMNLSASFTDHISHEYTSMDIFEESGQVRFLNIEKNLDIIPSHSRLSRLEKTLSAVDLGVLSKNIKKYNKYDFVIIDCPPSLGNLSIASLMASDYVLIPFECSLYCYQGLTELMTTINKVQSSGLNSNLKNLGMVINKHEKTIISDEILTELKREFGDLVFKQKISKSVKLIESPAVKQSIVEYDSKHKVSIQVTAFIDEILDKIKLNNSKEKKSA